MASTFPAQVRTRVRAAGWLTWLFVLFAGTLASGCSILPITLTIGSTDHLQAPQCRALESFFHAAIDDDWGGGLSVAGYGADAHHRKIVKYMDLAEDGSKRQMALAAAACEQYESGQITIDQYITLLDKSLDSAADAQAFNGLDPTTFLTKFGEIVDKSRQTDEDSRKELGDLRTKIDTLLAAVPALKARGESARADPQAAETLALEIDSRTHDSEVLLSGSISAETEFRTNAILALGRIERHMSASGPASVAPPETLRPANRQALLTRLFFSRGSTEIASTYQAELRAFVGAARLQVTNATIIARVVGYADASGTPARNAELALGRARTVAAFLQSLGVRDITVEAGGATKGFGPKLQMNRVVEVSIDVMADAGRAN